ncbi:MAG TPA: CRISPR-associated protein Cas4, partial [Candidatus Altiarchaeales archaeon]|nr:CRISPR-associated protein Cas4 [Candidatus Altiarchaeales archaeon]
MRLINVSELSQYCYCPKSVYFSIQGVKPERSEELLAGEIEHLVWREFSFHLPQAIEKVNKPFSKNEIFELLNRELEKVVTRVPYIYRNELAGLEFNSYVPKLRRNFNKSLEHIAEKVSLMLEEMEKAAVIERLTPWRVEFFLKSEKLGLQGKIDKVMLIDNKYIPVEIKTGNFHGRVWLKDKIQVCAYSMLLEECLKLKEAISYGIVEYSNYQESVVVINSEKLRREVFRIRDKILEIINGKVPKGVKNSKKCMSC